MKIKDMLEAVAAGTLTELEALALCPEPATWRGYELYDESPEAKRAYWRILKLLPARAVAVVYHEESKAETIAADRAMLSALGLEEE